MKNVGLKFRLDSNTADASLLPARLKALIHFRL